jgi:hypothetical protein
MLRSKTRRRHCYTFVATFGGAWADLPTHHVGTRDTGLLVANLVGGWRRSFRTDDVKSTCECPKCRSSSARSAATYVSLRPVR